MEEADIDLESMPDDEIIFVLEKDDDNDSEELYVDDEIIANNVIDKLVSIENIGDADTNVSVANAPDSDPLVPQMVADTFEKRLHDRLFDALKNILPQIPNDFVKKLLPKFDKRVKNTLKAKVHELVLKPQNKQFNALNKLESHKFVILKKKLRKSIRKKVGKFVHKNVKRQMGAINELFRQSAKHQMQLIHYIKQMLHSTVKVPRDIMVVIAKHLQTKVENDASNVHEMVELVHDLM
nr:hypothetical protein [Tanacetum cinerariifolium]